MKKKIKQLLKDKDFTELLKGSGVSFFLRVFGIGVGFLLTLIITHFYGGAKGLGSYILAITVFRLFVLLAKLGMDTTSIRFIASFVSQNKWKSFFRFRKKIITILSISSILSSLIMYSLSDQIARLINIEANYIVIFSFFVLPMSFFILHYQSLRGLKRIAEFSFFYRMSQAFFSIISIVIIYKFINTDDVDPFLQLPVPLFSYLISIIMISLLSFISFRYWVSKKSRIQESFKEEIVSYSTLLKISVPLMLAQSVQFVMAWTDKLMLGAIDTPDVLNATFTNAEEVGFYHAAFKLSMFATFTLMAINSIAAPKFAEMFGKNDMENLKKIVHQSTKMIFWTTLPLVVIFFTFPKFFLGIFGAEFAEKGVYVFLFLSCGRLISSLSGSVGNILQMTGNQNIYSIILLIGAIINVVLNLILIPRYGINGAAIASMTSLIIWNLSMVLVVKKRFGFYTFYIPFIKR